MYRRLVRMLGVMLLAVCLSGIHFAWASTTSVPDTGAVDEVVQGPITANQLKPAECAALDLQTIVTGSGTFNGTAGNDLILGSAGADVIDSLEGEDCVVGGGGNDQLLGGSSSQTESVRDEFSAISYSNQNGSQSWSSDWTEIGESDGPVSGDVNIEVFGGRGLYSLPADQDTYLEMRNPDTNYGTNNELKVKAQADDRKRALYRFNLAQIPAGANVLSATAYFYVTGANNNPVNVHQVTGSWGEATATWNNANGIYNPTPAASFTPAVNNQYISANVTALVQQWVSGSAPNHGVMLVGTVNNETKYASRENNPERHPYLLVEISLGGGTSTTYADQDTYLEMSHPSDNYGTNNELKVRAKVDDRKRALYRFNLAQIPAGATVLSATAYFYVTGANNNPVNVHRVTSSWEETTATWNNANGIYDPTPTTSFTPAVSNQYVSANVTALVQQWVSGSAPNYGVMLLGTVDNETKYASRENTPDKYPYLTITLAQGGTPQALRIQNTSKGAWRQVNLSTATTATLAFNYLRSGLDDSGDYVAVEISNTGGASWVELGRFSGPATEYQMQSASYDISSYRASDTRIRFISSGSLGVDDRVYFDNVQVSYGIASGDNDVLLGGAGDDTLDGGGGNDICYGGEGTDTFNSCETVVDP